MSDTVDIYIGFSRSRRGINRLFSNTVMWGETLEHFLLTGKWYNQPYSHVYVRWKSVETNVEVVYEASGMNLHFTNISTFKYKSVSTHEYKFTVTKAQYYKMLQFCMENAGVDYGYKQLVGIAWVKLNRVFRREISNPYGDNRKSQVCSEVTGYILEDTMELDVPVNLDVAGPRDIDDFLREINNEVSISDCVSFFTELQEG